MLFGRPLLAAISRSGNASPDDRNAERSCDAWTTDLTRYGSRAAGFAGGAFVTPRIMSGCFAERNCAGRRATRAGRCRVLASAKPVSFERRTEIR